QDFASAIHGEAGLYFWKGKSASPKWIKNDTPSLSASAKIPKPSLHKDGKFSLNFSSGTELKKVIKDKAFIKAIKNNRYYENEDDFRAKLTAEGIDGRKINGVLTNSKVVLGNVE
ncbi:MAG: hypothetical protein F6K24_19060, partial [Okeania sp. SIO2D1]|nr:hypothetical protein [Okeania sp. SIO2D1]